LIVDTGVNINASDQPKLSIQSGGRGILI